MMQINILQSRGPDRRGNGRRQILGDFKRRKFNYLRYRQLHSQRKNIGNSMKIFIVFIGLLVINVSYLSYQGDMENFVRKQAFLKFTAEECSAGAATLIVEEEYAAGRIVFNYEEGQKYADDYINYVKEKTKLKGTLSCSLTFEDDNLGYNIENLGNIPAVNAVVRYETEDIFRLPLITLTEIERSARYELE